ncbi:chorismate mutase, partial [Streptomyces sp. YIM B13508]
MGCHRQSGGPTGCVPSAPGTDPAVLEELTRLRDSIDNIDAAV